MEMWKKKERKNVNEVVRVELKRVLKPWVFVTIMAAVLIYSVYTGFNIFAGYNISDANGTIKITAKENLEKSKKYTALLDENTLLDVVERKDTSQLLYNSNLVLMVARNYDKKVTELTKHDLQNFYKNRIEGLMNWAEFQVDTEILPPSSEKKTNYLEKQAQNLETPLRLGYKEGWQSLNSNMRQIVVLVLLLASFLTLPVFAGNPKTRMKELCLSTQKGKLLHYKARIATGLLAALLIYLPAMLIFAVTYLTILGPQGGTLPIQSSVTYFFSAWNVTYIEQFIINFVLGLLAVLLMVAFVLFCGAALEQIISTSVVVAFFWIFMLTPQSATLVHYLYSFLPYQMADFSSLYLDNDTYAILGTVLPSWVWIGIVALFFFSTFLAALLLLAKHKVAGKRK